MRTLVGLVALVALTAPAHARPRAAILPLAVAGRDAQEQKLVTQLESALIEAARALTTIELVNLDGTRLRGPRAADAKGDPRPQARGQALAREVGAELAIVAEPQPLGEGAVVYLQAVEAGGKVRGSTTVALGGEVIRAGGADLSRALRGGVAQILDPAQFTGRLELHIDVKGAEVDIDGRKQPAAAGGAATVVELTVGTHAVRVTHPAYRDYLRFVEIAYDRTSVENVAMAAFPLTEGEMAEKRRGGPGPAPRRVPWYRSWWALGLTGAVLLGVTVGIVYGVRPGISADEKTGYRVEPAF